MRGSVNAQTHTGQMLPPCAQFNAEQICACFPSAAQKIAGCGLKHPAIQLTKLGFLPESYDFGEAAGLAFSFLDRKSVV